MNKKLVEIFLSRFIDRISKKGNWGKYEIINIAREVMNEALLEVLDDYDSRR